MISQKDGIARGSVNVYYLPDGTLRGEQLTVVALAHPDYAHAVQDQLPIVKAQAWREHYGVATPTPSVRKSRAEVARHYARLGTIQYAWFGGLAVAEPEVVGYIKHRPILSEAGKAALRATGRYSTPHRAYIHNIDVLPAHQGKGIGSALWHIALCSYPDGAEVVLEATGERGYTHEWFEKSGLKPNPEVTIDPLRVGRVKLAQLRYDGAYAHKVRQRLQAKLHRR